MPEETPAPETPEPAVNRTAFIPEAKIELSGDSGFRIVLNKAQLADLFDQSPDVVAGAGQGCISAPSGPSC